MNYQQATFVFLIKLGTLVFSFGVSAAMARVVDPKNLGEYFLVFSIVNFLVLFSQIGINQWVVRELSKNLSRQDRQAARNNLINSLLIVLLVSFFISLFVVFFINILININIFGGSELKNIMGFMVIWIIAGAMQSIIAEILRGYNLVVPATAFTGLSSSIILLSIIILSFVNIVTIKNSADLIYYTALSILMSLFLVFYILNTKVKINYRPHIFKFKKILTESMPFFFALLAIFLFEQIDLWVLGLLSSSEEVGYYGVALRLVRLIMFGLVVMNAFLPSNIARLYAQGNIEKLNKIMQQTTFIMLMLGLAVFVFYFNYGKYLLKILFGQEYVQAYSLLIILAVGQVINTVTGANAVLLAMTGYQKVLLKVTIDMLILKIILLVIAVYYFEAAGAAFVTSFILALYNIILLVKCKNKAGVILLKLPALKFRD